MDSFGQECPANWEEIANYLNNIIDSMDITDPDTGDITLDGREALVDLWERYCAGDMPDAPAPIME
jgi:hypothetical protein